MNTCVLILEFAGDLPGVCLSVRGAELIPGCGSVYYECLPCHTCAMTADDLLRFIEDGQKQ